MKLRMSGFNYQASTFQDPDGVKFAKTIIQVDVYLRMMENSSSCCGDGGIV